ncbi:S-layer homology domain-containing protein [Flavonifractor sp. An82]|uniref:S-layer homology domain-containing protein n=1 Tax=Flavonifractor sp. An82 TaxID=1965660 RepID=UPI001FA88DC4|nr:S-layer homology domain-containing protein [Flavonifractor sp. An82]
MKKLAALVLSAALLVGSAAALSPEEAFPKVNDYPGYTDVQAGSWYAAPVQVCYEVGLMTGTNTGFAPNQVLTAGEVAAIAARMNEAITGEPIPMATPKPGETLPWYFSYVEYLESLGIDVPDPTKQATRQEFVTLLSAVVPEDMLSPINTITALPDSTDPDVLRFYNAGILTGVDSWGTFAADKSLTRMETAAMVARVARTELRQSFTPADYTPFTAAGLNPSDVLFTGGTTAGAYLPYVQELIDGLEADCAAQGMEFNWFNTVDGISFLDYVKNTALTHFGVTAKEGTDLYKNFDVQVYYSRYLDLK